MRLCLSHSLRSTTAGGTTNSDKRLPISNSRSSVKFQH
nr:hypothetical protein Iba_chr07cCG10220 [Ipomoea batatas]